MFTKVKLMFGMLLLAVSFSASASVADISIGAGETGFTAGSLVVGDTSVLVELQDDAVTTYWSFSFNPDQADVDDSNLINTPVTFTASVFDGSTLLGTFGPTSTSPVNAVLKNLLAGTYTVVLNSDMVGGYSVAVSAVPVPAAALLFGSALLGFAGFSARRKVS